MGVYAEVWCSCESCHSRAAAQVSERWMGYHLNIDDLETFTHLEEDELARLKEELRGEPFRCYDCGHHSYPLGKGKTTVDRVREILFGG